MNHTYNFIANQIAVKRSQLEKLEASGESGSFDYKSLDAEVMDLEQQLEEMEDGDYDTN